MRNTLATHRSDPARITQLVPIAGSLKASSNHDEHKGHEDEDEVLHDTDVRPEATYNAEYWRRKGLDRPPVPIVSNLMCARTQTC